MATTQSILFSWDNVEALPDLHRLELVFRYLPDQDIIAALQQMRGRGRNDFPVATMWRALLAGVVFQHESIESLLRELRRNPALLTLCEFDPVPLQSLPKKVLERVDDVLKVNFVSQPQRSTIPDSHNFSRFLKLVVQMEQKQGLIAAMIPTLREQLMAVLPDFGQHLGYDGKAIDSHATGSKNKTTGKTSDPDADWGKHETKGVSKDGKPWQKIKTWFGYSLHLIADTAYEIPVAFSIQQASRSESKELAVQLKTLFSETPELRARCQDFTADRGLDSTALKENLWDQHHIRPLVDTVKHWQEEKQDPDYNPEIIVTRPLYPDRKASESLRFLVADNIVYSEKGEVFCDCPETGKQRPLAFQGFEATRNTLKYRCPAAAYGLKCDGREACYWQAGTKAGDYGRIVRIDIKKQDRRIFTPIPYDSPSWRRGYNRRSALERINSRIDQSFGFEHHYIRGKAKMQVRVGLALAIMMALALGHVQEGRPEQMRSLVKPVPLLDTG